jgi:hypothetical protein
VNFTKQHLNRALESGVAAFAWAMKADDAAGVD